MTEEFKFDLSSHQQQLFQQHIPACNAENNIGNDTRATTTTTVIIPTTSAGSQEQQQNIQAIQIDNANSLLIHNDGNEGSITHENVRFDC